MQKHLAAVLLVIAAVVTTTTAAATVPPATAAPVIKQECVTTNSSSGAGYLCVEITATPDGTSFTGAEARGSIETESTVVSTMNLDLKGWFEDNFLMAPPAKDWGFKRAEASTNLNRRLRSAEACVQGGVGIDSKDYRTVCVKLLP